MSLPRVCCLSTACLAYNCKYMCAFTVRRTSRSIYSPKHVFKDGQKSTTTANIPFSGQVHATLMFFSLNCASALLISLKFIVFLVLFLRSLLGPEPDDRDHSEGAPELHGHHSELGSAVVHKLG